MLKVGITGGIGVGKSIVGEIFELLGVPVFNADKEAKVLINSDIEIANGLNQLFDNKAFIGGELNKKYISGVVFENKEMLSKMNAIIHPKVANRFKEWCNNHELNGKSIILKEAAILVETEGYKELDKLIVVTAPDDLRIERVMKRDNVNSAEVQKRINNQMTQEEKVKYADFIIKNDESELVTPQVIAVYKQLKDLAK